MSNFSQGQGNQGITRPAPRREQVIPQIDPREICAAFHGAGAEIEEKGHFCMETNYSEEPSVAHIAECRRFQSTRHPHRYPDVKLLQNPWFFRHLLRP